MTLTVASLFDGIGGFPLAFERAGQDVVATVEIDTAAARIGRRHFPRAGQFPDVTKVTADDLASAGFVADRGVLTFGWPCQDFSVAGRRAGLAGARSGLWWEVVRIVAELRPRWLIGENVPGLLSSVCTPECPGGCMETHGGAMGAVLGSLGQLGYGVAYRVLDAQHFGVPQKRRRVFIVGHLGAPFGAAAQVLLEPESGDGHPPAGWQERADAANGAEDGTGATRRIVSSLTTSYCGGIGGVDDNAAQAGYVIAQPIATHGPEGVFVKDEGAPYFTLRAGDGSSSRQPLISITSVTGQRTHALTSEGADASEDGTGRGTPIVTYAPDTAATLTAGTAATPGVNPPGRRHEDDYNVVALDLRNAARASGTGVGTQGDGIRVGGPSYTLSATERAIPGVADDTIVRRLTELECERLQGYPDGWTDGQSGSARYRQLGNSVAVPVVEWVANRVVTVDREIHA